MRGADPGARPAIDRSAPRHRPYGWPILHQRWSRLLFMHWAFEPADVRPLVPPELELDLFAGKAWVSLAAFEVSAMRPTLLPPIPWLSTAEQINVRTYVHRDGVPGLWFLSLDASNPVAVWAARLAYALRTTRRGFGSPRRRLRVVSRRAHRCGSRIGPVDRRVAIRRAASARAWRNARLLSARALRPVLRIGRQSVASPHPPPALAAAAGDAPHFTSTMLEAAGLPERDDAPTVHAPGFPFNMGIWPPEPLPPGR